MTHRLGKERRTIGRQKAGLILLPEKREASPESPTTPKGAGGRKIVDKNIEFSQKLLTRDGSKQVSLNLNKSQVHYMLI